ncbi:MAG: SOS response-associated peptidase [Buchananella hordeovulneris]|nr:SOS response-associated peptidase [Buchananella hordeovulneris]
MCGRFALFMSDAEFIEEFGIERIGDPLLPDSWNIAPTHPINLVRTAPDGVRELRQARWGLVPSWAKDPAIGVRMINARSETADQKPSFKAALRSRRCLVPASGYYEWQLPGAQGGAGASAQGGAVGAGGGNVGPKGGAKQPYFIHAASGAALAMAGLYEAWQVPPGWSGQGLEPGQWLHTVTVLTRDANPELAHVHDRTPVVVPRDYWRAWLNPAPLSGAAAAGLLAELPRTELAAHPVGRKVGSVRHNHPGLVAPLAS